MTHKKLVVANWKMNLNVSQASLLVHRLHDNIHTHRSIEVVLAPHMLALQPVSIQIDRRKFRLAAQNAFHKDEGPFTGEVSFAMLRDLVHYVIIGHSDRRHKFGEDLDTIRIKMAACVRNGLTPILCVGETQQEKMDRETMQVIHDQVTTGLADLTASEVAGVVIAYEPVWALSSGTDYTHHEIPTPHSIARVATAIRHNIRHVYGEAAARQVRILYGGSTSASTAYGLMDSKGIDGLLVGGASLNYTEFSNIVHAAYRLAVAETAGDRDGIK